MWHGYVKFGSCELVNNVRTKTYYDNSCLLGKNIRVGDCVCPGLPLICDPGSGVDGAYTHVASDPAPWFNAQEPESLNFLGFFATEILGWESTGTREVYQTTYGSETSPVLTAGRTLTFRGWLVADECCGLQYGLRWLERMLDKQCNCGSADLQLFDCCPPFNEGDDPLLVRKKFLRYLFDVLELETPHHLTTTI